MSKDVEVVIYRVDGEEVCFLCEFEVAQEILKSYDSGIDVLVIEGGITIPTNEIEGIGAMLAILTQSADGRPTSLMQLFDIAERVL